MAMGEMTPEEHRIQCDKIKLMRETLAQLDRIEAQLKGLRKAVDKLKSEKIE